MAISALAFCGFCLVVVLLFSKARLLMALVVLSALALALLWFFIPSGVVTTFVTVPSPPFPWVAGDISLRNDTKSPPRFEVPIDDVGAFLSMVRPDDFPRLLAVYVHKKNEPIDRPAMVGSYGFEDGKLFFQPRYPLSPGVTYRAVFSTVQVRGLHKYAMEGVFVIPRPQTLTTSVVQRVYPTRSRLPENQLKFYIQFSAPMSRCEAYKRVHLLDSAGKEVDLPFLQLDEELWDPDGQRFTLLFDPGRIKHNLKPREEVGPSLVAGKQYAFVVDGDWPDAQGNPLKDSFRKTFDVLAPDTSQPDPAKWKLTPPVAGTVGALSLGFPEPLDHAMLHRVLWVVDAQGHKFPGEIKVSEEETRWDFTPQSAWAAGRYRLVIDTALEDLAGNSIAKPFEIDVFKTFDRQIKTETVELTFEVK